MRVLFLPGRWQNDREFGDIDGERDPRRFLRARGHYVDSVRYRIVDLQADMSALGRSSMRDMEADISVSWQRLTAGNTGPSVIMGYSLGASMALIMAAKLRPDALVLLDGGLVPSSDRMSRGGIFTEQILSNPVWMGRYKRLLDQWVRDGRGNTARLGPEALDRTQVQYLRECTFPLFPGRVIRDIELAAQTGEVERNVANIRCPILVVASDASGRSGLRALQTRQRHQWPGSAELIVPGASHMEMICGRQMISYWDNLEDWLDVHATTS